MVCNAPKLQRWLALTHQKGTPNGVRLLADKAVELELVESISYGEVRLILKKTNLNLT